MRVHKNHVGLQNRLFSTVLIQINQAVHLKSKERKKIFWIFLNYISYSEKFCKSPYVSATSTDMENISWTLSRPQRNSNSSSDTKMSPVTLPALPTNTPSMAIAFESVRILMFSLSGLKNRCERLCRGSTASAAPPILLLPPADVHELFPFHRKRPALGKIKIKKRCSHKLKLLEGERLGWHCKAQPSWITMCHRALKSHIHCHESHLEISGKLVFRKPTLQLKSEGSWQKDITHKNFWT